MKSNKKSPRPVLHQRPGSKEVPPFLKGLLLDPVFCRKIASSWPQFETLILECQRNVTNLADDAAEIGHLVKAINKLYKLWIVFNEQGKSDIEYYKTPTED